MQRVLRDPHDARLAGLDGPGPALRAVSGLLLGVAVGLVVLRGGTDRSGGPGAPAGRRRREPLR